ncbi:MAG: alkaline phosphatase family protein, partial [Phycisphaerae bacterium]
PTRTLQKREGTPFWDYLDEAGVPVRIYDIPANYPPSESRHGHMCCLSGMGVPDLLGGYGTYQFFSEDTLVPRSEGGGMRSPLIFEGDGVEATLVGPSNTYLKRPEQTEVRFTIHRDAREPSARIDLQGQTILLREGEWSDWVKVDFTLEMPVFLPNSHAHGICRFYLRKVRPRFQLYVTPINIDPSKPAGQRISEPEEFVTDIADELGLFYTTGFQEDHKALSNGVFNDDEYRNQSRYVLEERLNLLRYSRTHYKDGLLFFYFSSTDLQAHMFWWDSDEPHPVRSHTEARKRHQIIIDLYKQMDEVVGDVIEQYGDDATLLVMSDHGFCNFRRQFNVNTWLRNNGYILPADCKTLTDPSRGRLPDWTRTRAYGLGLNALYINLKGRERDGIVERDQKDTLISELTEKLLAIRDPVDGRPIIAEIYRTDEVYSGPQASKAPDLIIGYHRGYRASWATTLGNIEEETIQDNDSAWSADHCIAAGEVPGVLFSNRPIRRHNPSLLDLAPTILEEFGIDPPETMTGGSVYEARSPVLAAITNSDGGAQPSR